MVSKEHAERKGNVWGETTSGRNDPNRLVLTKSCSRTEFGRSYGNYRMGPDRIYGKLRENMIFRYRYLAVQIRLSLLYNKMVPPERQEDDSSIFGTSTNQSMRILMTWGTRGIYILYFLHVGKYIIQLKHVLSILS